MVRTISKACLLCIAFKYLLMTCVSAEEDAVEIWNHDVGSKGIPEAHSSANQSRIPYHDVTHFEGGMNGWDFMGRWSKYDLALLKEDFRPVPINTDKKDQFVFICHTSPLISILEKEFPALEEAKLTLSFYVSSQSDLTMEAVAEGAGGARQVVFNYSTPMDFSEMKDTWVTQDFTLDNFTREGKFELQFILRGKTDGIWATEEIIMDGFKPKSAPITVTGFPKPEGNGTEVPPNVNATEPTLNATTVGTNVNVTEGVNVTTVGSNVTVDANHTVSQNGTSNVTDSNGNFTTTTEGPVMPVNPAGPNITDGNVTLSPSINFTEVPLSNVSQETTSTVSSIPTTNTSANWTEPPEVNLTSNPQANNSGHTEAPRSNSTGFPPGNFTEEPPRNISVAPPSNQTGESPRNASSSPPSNATGVSTVSPGSSESPNAPISGDITHAGHSYNNGVGSLREIARAIWDAFYVFLALFCACLVALVALIVRGRCNSNPGTTTNHLQLSPPTTPGPPPTASTRSTITQDTRPMQYERSV